MCNSTMRTPRSHDVKDLFLQCTNVNVAVIILSSFDHSSCSEIILISSLVFVSEVVIMKKLSVPGRVFV